MENFLQKIFRLGASTPRAIKNAALDTLQEALKEKNIQAIQGVMTVLCDSYADDPKVITAVTAAIDQIKTDFPVDAYHIAVIALYYAPQSSNLYSALSSGWRGLADGAAAHDLTRALADTKALGLRAEPHSHRPGQEDPALEAETAIAWAAYATRLLNEDMTAFLEALEHAMRSGKDSCVGKAARQMVVDQADNMLAAIGREKTIDLVKELAQLVSPQRTSGNVYVDPEMERLAKDKWKELVRNCDDPAARLQHIKNGFCGDPTALIQQVAEEFIADWQTQTGETVEIPNRTRPVLKVWRLDR